MARPARYQTRNAPRSLRSRRRALRGRPEQREKYVARITQAQLDEAIAEPDDPPTLVSGHRDTATVELLSWRGGCLGEDESTNC